MSRLEQAEALLREYVGEWSRTGGELSPEWRNEWRDCVRTHLAAAPRSITRAEALAVAQPGDVLEGEAGVRRWALFMDTGKWLLDNGTHWLRDLTDQGGYSTPLHSTVRWHTLRTATGTYSITADAQPGDDSAEADGLAVGDWCIIDYPPGLSHCKAGYISHDFGVHSGVVRFALMGDDGGLGSFDTENLTRIPAPKFEIGQRLVHPQTGYSAGTVKSREWSTTGGCWGYHMAPPPAVATGGYWHESFLAADSAPPAEPSIADAPVSAAQMESDLYETAEKVDFLWEILTVPCEGCGGHDDEDCSLCGNENWRRTSRLDGIEQQLSDLAAKVEALSKPQVEAGGIDLRHSEAYAEIMGVLGNRYKCNEDRRQVLSMALRAVTPAPDAQAQEGQR